MKFANYELFESLFDKHGGDPHEIFKKVTRDYISKTGNDKHVDKKVDFVFNAAHSVASLDDPTKKIEKASRELEYDSSKMDALKKAIIPYLERSGKPRSGFDIFWQTLKKSIAKLAERDSKSAEKIIDAIYNRKISMEIEGGIFKGNIFNRIKEALDVDGEPVDNFLRDVYGMNVKVGNNPSGKGEYLLNLFIKGAVKSSDVRIDDHEFEIKTNSSAAIGESLGSKISYNEKLAYFFEQGKVELDYKKLSFGKLFFKKHWVPEFTKFTISNPELAKNFLVYQYTFFIQEEPKGFLNRIDDYLQTPGYEKLAACYDFLCVKYVRKALSVGEKKSMIVFEEKGGHGVPTGEFVAFDFDSIGRAISFAGSETDTVVKIQLPKSSATMRPEIESIRI